MKEGFQRLTIKNIEKKKEKHVFGLLNITERDD